MDARKPLIVKFDERLLEVPPLTDGISSITHEWIIQTGVSRS
jgi:hypothetical protein